MTPVTPWIIHRPCFEQFLMASSSARRLLAHIASRSYVFPLAGVVKKKENSSCAILFTTWMWIILSNVDHHIWEETLLLSFLNVVCLGGFFGTLRTTHREPSSFYNIREKANVSMADISQTWQLTVKLSRWINSTTGKRGNVRHPTLC